MLCSRVCLQKRNKCSSTRFSYPCTSTCVVKIRGSAPFSQLILMHFNRTPSVSWINLHFEHVKQQLTCAHLNIKLSELQSGEANLRGKVHSSLPLFLYQRSFFLIFHWTGIVAHASMNWFSQVMLLPGKTGSIPHQDQEIHLFYRFCPRWPKEHIYCTGVPG